MSRHSDSVSAGCCDTTTLNIDVPTVPSESVAVQVTIFVPTENAEFDDGVHVGPLAIPMEDVAVAFG